MRQFFKRTFRSVVMMAYSFEQKLFGGLGFGRIAVFKKIKRGLFSLVHPDFAEIHGLKIYLDPASGFLDPEKYKASVAEVLQRELKAGDTVLDIGANVGYFTCFMARLIERERERGTIIAFEPDPKNLDLLRKNISTNALENVVVVSKAVSDKFEKLRFFISGAHSSFGFDAVRSGGESIVVEAVTLDGFFGDAIPKINFIKMDIIGSEAKALAGMQKVLLANKKIKLLSAFCPAFLAHAGSDPAGYLLELLRLGFNIFDITKGDAAPVRRESVRDLVAQYSPAGKIAQAEIFCVR